MRRSRRLRGFRAIGIGWIAPAAVLIACVDADAAAIHHHESRADTASAAYAGIPASEVALFKEWSRYLLAGPETWSTVQHPPWTEVVKAAAWQGIEKDPGATDPMVNFLLWKQSIDPTRFAHYHPRLAPALHKIAMSRSSSSTVPTVGPTSTGSVGASTSPPSTSPPTSQQQYLNPPPVPEPSMLLLAAGMTAWFARRMLGRAGVGGE